MARPVEKRELIERGVVEVVAQKGLTATTIQDIARAADVSPGLLYRYWENRDDLAANVFQQHLDDLMGRLGRAALGEIDPIERFSAMLREFLRFADEQPTVLKFMLLSQHSLAERVPKERRLRASLIGYIQKAMETGAIRPMSVDLAFQIAVGVVMQPVIGAIYGDLEHPIEQHYEEIRAALLGALAVDAAVLGS